jgi:hypothetical protein
MLPSKLTPGAAKPLTRPEEDSLRDPRSTTDGGSPCPVQAKLRCLLNGLVPWVPASSPAVGRCASVWSYCLVRASGDVNCYLPC